MTRKKYYIGSKFLIVIMVIIVLFNHNSEVLAESNGKKPSEIVYNTYYIDSLEELIWFAEEVNSGNTFSKKTVHISGDIDLSNITWTPIGNDHTFEGSIEIVDCCIRNMKCSSLQSGLFGNINIRNLIVDNLSIDNATISVNKWDTHNIGLLAGTLKVSDNAFINIKNSSFNGTLSNNHNFDYGNSGGIFGTVICVGTNASVVIENTYVKTNITGANAVGGMIGHVDDSNLMNTFKFNRVIVDSEIYAANSYGYNDTFAGGLCGILNANKVFITQCTVKGSVYSSAYEGWCGGIAGRGDYNILQMSDCCVNASIDSTFGGWYGTQHCGAGFLGFSQCNDNTNSFIKNSYFNGTVNSGVAFVTRDNNAGDMSIHIINCYFDTTATGLGAQMMHSYSNAGQLMTNVLSGCAGYSSEQIKNKTNFMGWDFEKIWIMDSNAPRIRTRDEIEESDKIDFGTVTTMYKSDSSNVQLSIDWNLNSLIDIESGEDESLKLLGILLSKDAYHGTVSIAEHMIQFGLLENRGNLWEGQDLNTNTGVCFYVSVKKVEKENEDYYIVTAVSRGTILENWGIEWLYDIFGTRFFRSRGNELYDGIKKALEAEGVDMKDSRVRYFLTGHSLGGAVSNYLSNKLWDDGVDIDKIACYTYASPFTCNSWNHMPNGHIYNYIGLKDLVPTVGQATDDKNASNIVDWGTSRFGNDIFMKYESKFIETYNNIYYPEEWKKSSSIGWKDGSTAGNLVNLATSGFIYHALDTYLAQILADETCSYNVEVTTVTVLCPVDVYVYDDAGNVVASVIDNIVVNEGNEDVIIAVLDDAKFITLKNEGDYTIKYIGTDTGTMSTTITKKTASGETVKTFSNVALEEGKQMVASIQQDETSQDVRLFVVDDEQNILSEITESGVETNTKLPNTDAKDSTRSHILIFFFLMVLTIGAYGVNLKYKG